MAVLSKAKTTFMHSAVLFGRWASPTTPSTDWPNEMVISRTSGVQYDKLPPKASGAECS